MAKFLKFLLLELALMLDGALLAAWALPLALVVAALWEVLN
jgi:hypothetical protein